MGVEDAADKGDALLREYARTLIEYIEYYLRFDGVQGDMVSPIIDEKLDQLGDVYYLAVYAGRKEVIGEINAYYRSLGVEEENLVDVGDKPHRSIRPLSRAKTPRNSPHRGQKTKAPPLRRGLFTYYGSGLPAGNSRSHPRSRAPAVKRQGTPASVGSLRSKRYQQQRVHIFSDASSRTVSCQAVLARFLYDGKDRQISRQ